MDSRMNSTVTLLLIAPHGLRVASTLFAVLVALLSLNTAFGATWSQSHSSLKDLFEPVERRAMLAQYMLAVPLFEWFVVWGSPSGFSVEPNSSSVLIMHVLVSVLSVALLGLAQVAILRARALVHITQAMRIVVCIAVFCDRATRRVLGYEAFFVGVVLVCAMFEVVHVRVNFIVPAGRASESVDDTPLRKLAWARDRNRAAARRERVAQMASQMHIDTTSDDDGSVDFECFNDDVPLTARSHLRTQRAEAALAGTLRGITDMNIERMNASQTRRALADLQRAVASAGVTNSTSSTSQPTLYTSPPRLPRGTSRTKRSSVTFPADTSDY